MQNLLILPEDFDHSTAFDIGGKGSHLARMENAGLKVPPFFMLSAKAVAFFLEPIQKELAQLLSTLRSAQDSDLYTIAEKIRIKILSLDFPTFLEKEILRNCSERFGRNYSVAIRSSAADEDGSHASFAGQHESYLHVSAAAVIFKIKQCIASAWGFGALSYRLAQGISIQDIRSAVIIQKMVMAVKSGISFSMNINGNLADAAIVAGFGLGEGIVQDRVETDFYTVNRKDLSIEKNVVTKKIQLLYNAETGIAEQNVAPEISEAAVLTDKEILKVVDLVMTAEQLLGHPADVEFSFTENGQLYALQMRPVTTLDISQLEILDNTNIVESYPGVTLPLSYSFALDAYNKVFTGSSKAFWVSKKIMTQHKELFQNLLAHYYGRVYYRLDNWYKMITLVHGSARSVAAWEKAVGLPVGEEKRIPFTLWKKVKMVISVLYLLAGYRRNNRYFFKTFNEYYQQLRAIPRLCNTPDLLWREYEKVTALMFKPWYITLVNDFLAFQFFAWLQQLLSVFELPENTSLANDLLCGMGGVESEEAILNVLKLKEAIAVDKALTILFQEAPETILKVLKKDTHPVFSALFFQHLEKYGDRTLTELKLETSSLRNNPVSFIHLLKNQLETDQKISDFEKRQEAIRQKAEDLVNARWKWWQPNAYLFPFVRSLAAYGLKNRENMRFCRTRAYGAVKDIFLAIGEEMVAAKVISQINDVFYLELSDLEAFCKDSVRESKAAHVARLKREYKAYEELRLPDRIIYPKGKLPKLAEHMNKSKKDADSAQGIAVSGGIATAEAAVITNPEPQLQVHGKILISKMTDPGWVFLMMQSAGLVSEKGSLLSHTAIVGRELGIPVVVGVKNATTRFKSGDIVTIDGGAGTVVLAKTGCLKN